MVLISTAFLDRVLMVYLWLFYNRFFTSFSNPCWSPCNCSHFSKASSVFPLAQPGVTLFSTPDTLIYQQILSSLFWNICSQPTFHYLHTYNWYNHIIFHLDLCCRQLVSLLPRILSMCPWWLQSVWEKLSRAIICQVIAFAHNSVTSKNANVRCVHCGIWQASYSFQP
jgi:hypothetical protein